MPKTESSLASHWHALTLAAAVAAVAGPSLAQTTLPEITVTGRYGSEANAPRLSEPVSYADLDLTTQAGRNTLQERVRTKANDLCRRLGEGRMGGTALAPSCERDAINSTREQQRLAIASATPRMAAAQPSEPAAAPTGETADTSATAPTAEEQGQPASVTVRTVTNGPVPDTAENRERFGGPDSAAGRRTAPKGN